MSVIYAHAVANPRNAAPKTNIHGLVNELIHISEGTSTRYIAIGWINATAQAFFILAPKIVVKIPILKLAKTIIPIVT